MTIGGCLGFILEEISTMVVMVPIFWPSVLQLGIDPLHFGVVICTAAAIGYSTPPITIRSNPIFPNPSASEANAVGTPSMVTTAFTP